MEPAISTTGLPARGGAIVRPEMRPDTAELFLSSSGRLSRPPFIAAIAAVLGTLWLYDRWVGGVARLATLWAVDLVVLFAGCCLVTRRLHDLGRAGWWTAWPLALFVLVWPQPKGVDRLFLAAVLGFLTLWLCAMPGQRRANRFGASLRD